MRTFQFELTVQVRAVVPDNFLTGQLEAAADHDATPFQQQLLQRYLVAKEVAGEDEAAQDEATDNFLMELLGNGLRYGLRHQAIGMLEQSGIGGTVAPVSVPVRLALKPELVEEEVK